MVIRLTRIRLILTVIEEGEVDDETRHVQVKVRMTATAGAFHMSEYVDVCTVYGYG